MYKWRWIFVVLMMFSNWFLPYPSNLFYEASSMDYR